eukprot:6184466-Pleurochrysis_carterae.AAC.1
MRRSATPAPRMETCSEVVRQKARRTHEGHGLPLPATAASQFSSISKLQAASRSSSKAAMDSVRTHARTATHARARASSVGANTPVRELRA